MVRQYQNMTSWGGKKREKQQDKLWNVPERDEDVIFKKP